MSVYGPGVKVSALHYLKYSRTLIHHSNVARQTIKVVGMGANPSHTRTVNHVHG
jgi:hypothetical protein